MASLQLSVAVGDYDRIRPLLDGGVRSDAVDPQPMVLEPGDLFFRAFRHAEFEVTTGGMIARGQVHRVLRPWRHRNGEGLAACVRNAATHLHRPRKRPLRPGPRRPPRRLRTRPMRHRPARA